MDKAGTATRPEDIFVELFAQVFGLEKAERLSHEFDVLDIYNQPRRIDYALEIAGKRIAFEIDGLAWHHPNALSVFEYEDQLHRQNSLVADGWRVFRWTDHEIVEKPDRVKEELTRFLESIPGLFDDADFLPKRECVQFDFFEHQQETLDYLAQQRSMGKTMALVVHATGTGKTVTAINDARRIGLRTLYVAHTTNLVKQTARAFRQHWPEVHTGIYSGPRKEAETHIVAATVQSLGRNLEKFSPDDFGYIIIDEAHHAPADTYGRILSFFTPRFILGLTATPERPDSQSVLDLFETSAHRLTLEQAIETGCLVPIRCFRVKTNVDLSHVRYNRIQYNRRDIEKSIRLPGRNRLIVDTYLKHVKGRRAVVFCVSVQHAEDVAALFNEKGITAASVSGLLSVKKRDEVLAAFRDNKLSILCACDILNEGWDCPEVEVLMMARPTLSKIIYMQQLGRGTRCAPGKESLLVIDFVDNASRYSVKPDLIILQNSLAFAMFDGIPVSQGHSLIIPRRHVADYSDLTVDEILAIHKILAEARSLVQERFFPDGFNIGVNIGFTSGQTIMHVHVHLIPRYKGDVSDPVGGVRNVIPGKGNYLRSSKWKQIHA